MRAKEVSEVGGCNISIVLDKRTSKGNGTYPVSLRFTINRKSWYYRIGDNLTESEFDQIQNTSSRKGRPTEKQLSRSKIKESWIAQLEAYKERVSEIAKRNSLTIDLLRANLVGKSIKSSFIDVWEGIISERRYCTAQSYTYALHSFTRHTGFTKEDGFSVNAETFHRWVQGMTDEGFRKTTIGIYLRVARVVYNECIRLGYIQQKEYPFSNKSDRAHDESISIPRGSSRKSQYLNVNQMTDLFNLFISGDVEKIKVRYKYQTKLIKENLGLFLFMYCGNGMNLADVAYLKYDDYYFQSDGKAFRFNRSKTKDRSDNESEVIVPVIEPLRKIIDAIGSKPSYGKLVFPKILANASNEEQRTKRIALVNASVLDNMRRVSDYLGWNIRPSATWARHSFATNLTHQSVPERYISESMGHSVDKSVTSRYIADFPLERQMEYNSLLFRLEDEAEKQKRKDLATELLMSLTAEERAELIKSLL